MDESVQIPLDYYFPESLVTRFATNMVIQHSQEEFVLSFFEVKGPILLGTKEETQATLKSLKSVRADCVARLIITPGRMLGFISAMEQNWATYLAKKGEPSE